MKKAPVHIAWRETPPQHGRTPAAKEQDTPAILITLVFAGEAKRDEITSFIFENAVKFEANESNPKK
jgi:hypothetical protein